MQKVIKKVASIAAILSVVFVGAPVSNVEASTYFSPSISADRQVAKPGDVVTYTLKIKGTGHSDSIHTGVSFSNLLEYVPGSATATKGSNVANLGDSFINDKTFRNLMQDLE